VQKQIAVWNTDLKLWTKPNEVLFSEHLELFSATWPTSGMTQNGVAYELAMQVPRINDSESLLSQDLVCKVSVPTPTVSDTSFDKPGLMRTVTKTAPNRGVGLPLWANRIATQFYLPTPTTRDYKDGSQPHERDGKVQTDTVARAVFNSGEVILPTPTTNGNDRKGPNYSSAGILQALEIANGILPKEYTDWEHARQKIKWAESVEGQNKTTLDSEISWGKFGPAIQLWEKYVGRKSPAPTKPDGKEGNHRLSSKFTEWMMGLPEGWITDVGLTRNEELKLAGNGVVPQQAELALKILLENTPPVRSELD